jgi:RES domain-containing protein
MSLTAWRLVKREYQRDAFSGEGARLYGGRWNSPGLRMVYTAEHASLAVLEILVHVQSPTLLRSYVLFKIEFQAKQMTTINSTTLPKEWRNSPPGQSGQQYGDSWMLSTRSLVLSVPSAVLPLERNYLINPDHPNFKDLAIEGPIDPDIDPRLSRS